MVCCVLDAVPHVCGYLTILCAAPRNGPIHISLDFFRLLDHMFGLRLVVEVVVGSVEGTETQHGFLLMTLKLEQTKFNVGFWSSANLRSLLRESKTIARIKTGFC